MESTNSPLTPVWMAITVDSSSSRSTLLSFSDATSTSSTLSDPLGFSTIGAWVSSSVKCFTVGFSGTVELADDWKSNGAVSRFSFAADDWKSNVAVSRFSFATEGASALTVLFSTRCWEDLLRKLQHRLSLDSLLWK